MEQAKNVPEVRTVLSEWRGIGESAFTGNGSTGSMGASLEQTKNVPKIETVLLSGKEL